MGRFLEELEINSIKPLMKRMHEIMDSSISKIQQIQDEYPQIDQNDMDEIVERR